MTWCDHQQNKIKTAITQVANPFNNMFTCNEHFRVQQSTQFLGGTMAEMVGIVFRSSQRKAAKIGSCISCLSAGHISAPHHVALWFHCSNIDAVSFILARFLFTASPILTPCVSTTQKCCCGPLAQCSASLKQSVSVDCKL